MSIGKIFSDNSYPRHFLWVERFQSACPAAQRRKNSWKRKIYRKSFGRELSIRRRFGCCPVHDSRTPPNPISFPALALYAKERRWNLPPILTPTKVSRTQPLPREDYLLRLTAYPSLPDALFYQAVFGGNLDNTRAFLHLNRKQLGDERTKGRGDYSADGIRGGLTYQYGERSELAVDAALDLEESQLADDRTGRITHYWKRGTTSPFQCPLGTREFLNEDALRYPST